MTTHYKINYPQLQRLLELKELKAKIEDEEKLLSKPLCDDTNGLVAMHLRFRQIMNHLPKRNRPEIRLQKKLFLFIALYIYSPGTLAGHSINRGARMTLARVMGFRSGAAVTYHCEGLGNWYGMYPDFRNLVDYLFPLLIGEVTTVDVNGITGIMKIAV